MKNYLTKTNNMLTPYFGLSKGLSNFFDDFFSDWSTSLTPSLSHWTPQTDLTETSDEYQITLDLPGIALENLDVSIKDNVLSISGERKSEEETKGKHYYRSERSYGKFVRSFKLPEDIATEDSIKATHKNGVLTISVPKQIDDQNVEDTAKKINVNSED